MNNSFDFNMFNSVAKYLWGGSSDSELKCPDKDNIEQQNGGDNLEIQQEEDWVVVNTADKENNGQLAHHGHRCQHPCQYHQTHTNPSQLSYFGGHDSLSQNSSSASEAELLDDADTLAQSMSTSTFCLPSSDTHTNSVVCPLHDCGWTNQDVDRYSDTESLPESVFSACSGRSHATYHPCGSQSEPWVVAPPPCFTGSQVGGSSPIASSPLENLLIEHPSMSVYLSFPPSHPILSNRHINETANNSLKEKINNIESSGQHMMCGQISNFEDRNEGNTIALQQRNTYVRAAIHTGPFLPQQFLENAQLAQRMQCIEAKKGISRNKCECQNKVKEYQGHAKGNNRRNKRVRPSGFRSSRFNQHM